MCRGYAAKATVKECYLSFSERGAAGDFVKGEAGEGDIVLVMGVRDNSLTLWAASMTMVGG